MSHLLLILVCLQDANQWLLRRFTRLALPPVAAQQLFLTSTLIVFYSHFQVFLQITTYGILPRLLRFRYKWRQLHELQLPNRRSWSVYPSFSFQILLLIDDTEYSRNTSTRERKKKGLGGRQPELSEVSQ